MRVSTFLNGKVDLCIDVPDLAQATAILKSALTAQKLKQLSVTVDGCTAYWDDSSEQLVKGAPWDTMAASYNASAKKLAEQIDQEIATMLPTKRPDTRLSGRIQDKPDW